MLTVESRWSESRHRPQCLFLPFGRDVTRRPQLTPVAVPQRRLTGHFNPFRSEDLMISVENLIGLTGGIALVIYLFVALTHPERF